MTEQNDPPPLGEFNGHEIYPMPMFATLTVADVNALSRWYQDALGFATIFAGPPIAGQPSMVHLRRRKYQDLLIVPSRAAGSTAAAPPSTLTLTFALDDVDALGAQARGVPPVGASSVSGPEDTPWNTRDLRVLDPAGHQLIFTARQANPDPEQAKRLQAMFDAARKKT